MVGRRTTALLGIFAIVFQAALFAWHHHVVALPSPGVPTIGCLVSLSSDQTPIADDDCPLCFALAHHNVTPIDFFAAPVGLAAPLPRLLLAAATCRLPTYLLFRSRAPPLT
jgi:hypothetical protein